MNVRGCIVVCIALCVSVPAHAQNAQTPAVLAQHRVDAAQSVLTRLTAMYQAGTATLDDLATWTAKLYQARRDTGMTGAPLIAAAQDWVDKMRTLEQLVKARVQTGVASSVDVDKIAFYRLEAEMQLAKLKTP